METALQRARRHFNSSRLGRPNPDTVVLTIGSILEHLEDLETSSLAKQETPSSSEAIETQEDGQSTRPISSQTFSLVKEGPNGGELITVTATFRGHSFIGTVGELLRRLQDGDWMVYDRSMWEWQSLPGLEPLSEKESTPEVNQAGLPAGGDETDSSDEVHRILWPDGGFWIHVIDGEHRIVGGGIYAHCESCGKVVLIRVP